jgi:L-alanine-DL-glutamate epimerase-like enolase superfamily enzyme
MFRRDFLLKTGLFTTGLFFSQKEIFAAPTNQEKYPELAKHIVDRVEFGYANYHWPRLVGKNGRIGVHGQHKRDAYVQILTDQGAVGWGATRGNLRNKSELARELLGKSVDQLIIPEQGIPDSVHEAFDLALHDLAGLILNKPVYELLGAQGLKENLVYSGMIYLDELEPEENPAGIDKVLENCQWDYDYGYRQLKVKIGRSGRWYPHDEGLAMDIRVVNTIYKMFKDKQVDILVDSNDMYSLQDTMDFFKGVEEVPIFWMEEPFVENLEESRQLKKWMRANGREKTYYADGERNPDYPVCEQLAKENTLDVYLPDVVGLGFTPWRKLMPFLKKNNTLASPHAWGSRLKTHYAAHLSAGLGNVVTLEGVTCESDEIDYGDYPIVNGKLRVSEAPGFGMKLIST